MKRHALLAILPLASALVATVAAAQTPPRRIGVLLISTDCPPPAPLVDGLAGLGWVEGRTAAFDCVSAHGHFDEVAPLATALAARRPDVIVSSTLLAAWPLRAATKTIPLVMLGVTDPVDQGLAASLARPGGNLTGLVAILFEVESKRIELLKEAVPKLARLAVVSRSRFAADNTFAKSVAHMLDHAASIHGFTYQRFPTEYGDDIPGVFAAIKAQRFDAAYLVPAPLTADHIARLGEAARHSLVPTIGTFAALADAGALLTYGASDAHVAQRGAVYVDKILRGANPAELPFEQPSEFDLVINLATAKALGIEIPPSLLVRATRVIE